MGTLWEHCGNIVYPCQVLGIVLEDLHQLGTGGRGTSWEHCGNIVYPGQVLGIVLEDLHQLGTGGRGTSWEHLDVESMC